MSQLQKLHEQMIQRNKKHFHSLILNENCLCQNQRILDREKKRFGVENEKISLQELGFVSIKNKNNLVNLAKENKLRILEVKAESMSKTIITIQAFCDLRVSLQSGTFLAPASQESNSQNLILAEDTETDCSEGINQFKLKTFCFNSQCSSPSNQFYYFGTLKFVHYKQGLSQSEVWQLTVQQIIKVEQLEKKYVQREIVIGIAKKEIKQMIDLWN